MFFTCNDPDEYQRLFSFVTVLVPIVLYMLSLYPWHFSPSALCDGKLGFISYHIVVAKTLFSLGCVNESTLTSVV